MREQKIWRPKAANLQRDPMCIERRTSCNPPRRRASSDLEGPEMSNCQGYKNAIEEPHLSLPYISRGRRRTRPYTARCCLTHPTRTSRGKQGRPRRSIRTALKAGGIDRLKKDGARDEGPIAEHVQRVEGTCLGEGPLLGLGDLNCFIRALAPLKIWIWRAVLRRPSRSVWRT